MTIKPPSYTVPNQQSDTSAPGFHLSDTLDWSSLAAQIKNRVIILPAYTLLAKSEIRKSNSPSVKNQSDDSETSRQP